MANYVKFKQGLKKDFNTTNQPLTNGMIYFVIDENNHGSIYYDTIVDGKKATKNGTVHRVKFSGLPIKITGSVIGTGVISQDGETIEINTSTNHSHGLAHQDFTVTLSDDNTNLKWTRLGNQNGGGFWLKSIRGQSKAPAWFLPDFSAGIAFGGADTKGIISVKYSQPGVRFAGGNGDAPVWYFTITGSNDKTYDLNGIGGHSSDSAKLDHNVTFKIASTADATKGGNGTATNLSGSAVDLYLPTKISGFDLLQASRFQGNADTSTVAAKLGRGGNTSLPMTFNWSGQGGQPTWLWGGENGTDMYVYNPSNFRVAHSVNTAGLDHNITFKISKVADATIGETGVVTQLTESAITFTIPSNLSGFNNIQSTRFQGTADNADTVDYFHVAEEKYKYETTKTQPTSGADWCIKISTPDWNSWSETIYLTASGNNTNGTVILKTGSRQNNWWGYATSYNGTGIIGVYKLVSNSDDVYIKVNGAYTSVRIRTTFNPTISIPATIPDYKFTSVPYQGGFFSNAIYTDTLTFTTPKYWANIPISDNSKTDTQPTFNTAYVSNWWRSTGNTGWWNETHRGGVTMEDDTYVKVAGNKSFLIPSGSLKIGGNGNIFFATGNDNATLKVYGQTNTDFGTETIAIQTCFDNEDPQTSGYTTQYANRCNLLLQPRGGQVYIGKNLTTVGDTGYKLLVDGNQLTNGSLFFTDITGNTTDTGTSLKGVYGRIGGNDGWRIAGGARADNAGYLEIATCDDANDPIYVRQYGDGGNWNGYVSLARTFTLLDAAGRSRAPELFEAKKVHVNSLSDQSVAIADIGYQFQVTGTSNFTDSVNISGVTTHHNNIQIDTNYSIAKPGHSVSWNQSHSTAMIRMTSINGWSPLLAQKATDGYWVLGHYTEGDFKNQWLFGYLADSNLEGTTGASNSLTTTYRLLNIGGNDSQRMFVSAKYNAAVGSGTQPVYVQNNGNVAACSYSLSATIEAGTANRMAYYKAANQIGSSGHYVTSSQVGINSNTTYDFTFYVGGNSYFSNLVTVYAGNNLGVKIGNTNITAIDGSLIFQNNTALRFGSSEWNWDKWAGLKYVPDSKTIVMGLADSTNFTANSVQSGGTFLFTGISTIDLNKTASIKNLAVGGGIYWNPYVESAGDGSDAASITVIAGGVAGGTELRIQQQDNANDVINLVVNNSIFLNSKRAFTLYDDWLRINEDSSFGGGIYTGSSLIRSDNQLQVGNNGANFYANSSGNGYFSNTLGIAGTNINYKLYVNGNSYFNGTLRAKGPIEIGSDANGRGNNYIAFYGITGDQPGDFNHAYIGENLWGSPESSELVLFKGNDIGADATIVSNSGPDRIRHIAAGHVFQVYRSALSGTFDAICTSTVPSTVVEMNGSGLMISGLNSTSFTPNGASAAVTVNRSILTIYGTTYGNTAGQLKSNTAGVMSYGDGGPQIDFSASRTGGQRGAIIFTDNDSAGNGVSWHFVSTEPDWSINSKRFVAKSSVTIGQDLQNSAYNLYVKGSTYHTDVVYFGDSTDYFIDKTANGKFKSLFIDTGDATLKVYSTKTVDAQNDGSIGLQTCIDRQDGQTHNYAVDYQSRETLCLQPRGGCVYIGATPGGYNSHNFYVNGSSYFSGNIYPAGNIYPTGNIYIGPNGAGGYLNGSSANGGCNSIMVGDDVWLGDVNQSGIMGMKSTGTNTGFWFYNSSGSNTGKLFVDSSNNLLSNNNILPLTNNAYNIGSISNYWATGYINTLYVAGNAYANGSKRIPTTGNTNGTIGSTTVPVYSDNGVLKAITSYSGNAATATNVAWSGITNKPPYYDIPRYTSNIGYYESSDTHILKLGYWNCTGSYDNLTLLVSSSFWGNQHGSTDIITLRQDLNDNSGNLVKCSCNRVKLMDSNRIFYYNIDQTNRRVYLYVYVIGGNSYGKWNTSVLQSDGGFWTSEFAGNQPNQSSFITISGTTVETTINADTVDGYHANAFVKKAGDTMSGPLTFANGTCNVVGDDCGMGDINSAGTLAFQGKNGATNLWLVQYGEAWSASANHATISYDGTKVSCDKPFYGAVWNDYAEYRKTHHEIEPGRCVIEVGDGSLTLAFDRMQPGGNIVSDTYGFAIGEAKECKTPIAVSGRVLAYPYEDRDSYQAGDPVCSGPNGTISKMTREEVREYPDRIIGTVSEIPDYEVWGTGNVKVNNRIWIKVR